MKQASLQPTAEDTWRIVYDPESRGPGYEQALRRAQEQQNEGDIEGACNTRFAAFQALADLIPEDEDTVLDWEDRTTRSALELLHGSAVDHFLAGDFEMSAAMLEMLLDLDPEDHLDATRQLAYCYVALGEWELFDEALADVNERSVEYALLALWAGFQREGALPTDALARFRGDFADYFAEFKAAEHPADEAYLNDIESERPSRRALARELWLQTEHLWAAFPGFTQALAK
ncbi:MAG: tetratricopeptide repeat protein [Rikenellaceae bacterium]|jgi:hypothetical protein|nr:tetratricopeptide repeat protein [Rikenellaceae bacterium]